MTKRDVIHRYCALSARVATGVFGYTYAADCFCDESPFKVTPKNYRYEEPTLKFIEEAVEEKIKRTNNAPNAAPTTSESPSD